MPTFEQVYTPVADSLVLSTLVAAVPIAVLSCAGGFRVAAHWSSLASLAWRSSLRWPCTYASGPSLELDARGIAFGLFPIVWIVITQRLQDTNRSELPFAPC